MFLLLLACISSPPETCVPPLVASRADFVHGEAVSMEGVLTHHRLSERRPKAPVLLLPDASIVVLPGDWQRDWAAIEGRTLHITGVMTQQATRTPLETVASVTTQRIQVRDRAGSRLRPKPLPKGQREWVASTTCVDTHRQSRP